MEKKKSKMTEAQREELKNNIKRFKTLKVLSLVSIYLPESVEIPLANLRNQKKNKEILNIILDAIDNGIATLDSAGLNSDPSKLHTTTGANHKDFKTAVLFQHRTVEPVFDFSQDPTQILRDVAHAIRIAPYALRYVDRTTDSGREIIISSRELG